MKKALLKIFVCILTFCVSVVVISMLINKGNRDLTATMSSATFPVIYMGINGEVYNELHGYAEKMDSIYMRETITTLDLGRTTEFTIDKYGQDIHKLYFEMRSIDGERLIEKTQISDYTEDNKQIKGKITVKDLIEKNKEYELIFVLSTETSNEIYYYTRVVWTQDYHMAEKLEFARTFTEKTFDKESVKDLTMYMETNSKGDNSTLHYVDIHCSLNQVSWGNLQVQRETTPVYNVKELATETCNIVSNFVVSTGEGSNKKYFYVEEHFRLRYTTTRIYLLDYTRTMTSMIDVKDTICINDKIVLGVAEEDLEIVESSDGNVLAFVMHNRLYSYNVTTNKLAVVFGFYDDDIHDARDMHNQHKIRALNVDASGNVQFVVYGYMNRGRHEGEVGIQVYTFNGSLNTIEEDVYIPYDKPYDVLEAQMEQFLYLSQDNYLYLILEDVAYEVNLVAKNCKTIFETSHDNSMQVSESNQMVAWQSDGGRYTSKALALKDLGNRKQITISAGPGEYLMPLGFMDEDLVYGVARGEDISVGADGHVIFPMYALHICNKAGETLKTYSQENMYVVSCSIDANQITMERMTKNVRGEFVNTYKDHIMNKNVATSGKNVIDVVITENYGKYVQIKVKKTMDSKSLQVLTPKEILFEGSRDLLLNTDITDDKFYVYSLNGVEGIFSEAANAVRLAEETAGNVMNQNGDYVWYRGNRLVKNQIMAIEAAAISQEKSSLVVCLETILKFAGVSRNVNSLLEEGKTVVEILSENISNAQVLDLRTCSMDAMLYYVNQDIPILAQVGDEAVLIIGFNQYNVVLMNPSNGRIYKMGMNDAKNWFEENGNSFITYINMRVD